MNRSAPAPANAEIDHIHFRLAQLRPSHRRINSIATRRAAEHPRPSSTGGTAAARSSHAPPAHQRNTSQPPVAKVVASLFLATEGAPITRRGFRVCDLFDFLCFQNAFAAGCL